MTDISTGIPFSLFIPRRHIIYYLGSSDVGCFFGIIVFPRMQMKEKEMPTLRQKKRKSRVNERTNEHIFCHRNFALFAIARRSVCVADYSIAFFPIWSKKSNYNCSTHFSFPAAVFFLCCTTRKQLFTRDLSSRIIRSFGGENYGLTKGN